MKRLVLVAVMLLVPFASFALEAMNDEALDELTAQEGVTITFNQVVITQTASDTSWGDSDGDGAGTTAGYIFMDQNGSTVTRIDGALTIDVATVDPTGSGLVVAGETIAAGDTYVKIGLPSISQEAAAKTNTISLSSSQTTAGTNVLGTLWQNAGSSEVAGEVYIYAH